MVSYKNNLKHFPIMSYIKLALWWQPSLISNWHEKFEFCKGHPKIIHVQLGFNQTYRPWENIFFIFPQDPQRQSFPTGSTEAVIFPIDTFCKGTSKAHSIQVCCQFVPWFQIYFLYLPIGSNDKTRSCGGGLLDFRSTQKQILSRTIQAKFTVKWFR